MADRRRAEIAKIHIGKKVLGLEDDDYRNLLFRVARVRSARDLDEKGRQAVLQEMRRLGVKFRSGKRTQRSAQPEEKRPLLSKITALLAESGRPEEYAEAILRRMTGHHHRTPLSWATPKQLHDVVAALSYDHRRREKRA